MRRLALLLLASGVLSLGLPTGAEAAPKARKARARPKPVRPARPEAAAALGGRCPADMVRVREFCIDRWESSLVDATSGRALSPWYPPDPAALARVREVWMVERWAWGDPGASAMPLPEPPRFQLEGRVTPKAVSRGGTVPNGYLTYYAARAACQNAGKRLCREEEWVTACRGERQLEFPYGAHYLPGKCNVHRAIHPAAVLHDNASIGLIDPRLNLVVEQGTDPLLHVTGASPECASVWGDDRIYDMVGNLDEWVDDSSGVFVGGFYSRLTTKGCEAKVKSHAPSYFDYSLGTRCCLDPA